MNNLKTLRKLELIDLMLDPQEAQYLLDGVCESCNLSIYTIILINTTRVQYQILHIGVFLNLHILVISPQNLGDDLVELLGYTRLMHLHIVQNRYSPSDITIKCVSPKAWKTCHKNNPELCVHLQLQTIKEKQLLWQECAPVKTVLYDSPHIRLQADAVITVLELYQKDLRIYGHQNLPRFHRSKSFHERIDGSILLLCRECPNLKILVITERISTSTVLLIPHIAKNLRYLHIRKNAVIIRCDWPASSEWSEEFYTWLKMNSKKYNLVEKEVSQMLNCAWQMLTDKQFKQLHINMHNESVML